MTDERYRVVVTDACVLINLLHVNRLDLLGRLPAIEFVVPDHVLDEIAVSEQRIVVERSLSAGVLRLFSITAAEDIAAFAELTRHLGRGESACLVIAEANGWSIASDEKGRFRREALARIGKARLLGTVELYTVAVRVGLLSVEQANTDKAILEQRRFRMPFGSFSEILPDAGEDPE